MELVEKRIYHITPFDNLSSILDQKGLYSKHEINNNHSRYSNIAHMSIQEKRMAKEVPVDPFQTLHHYVPFYFAPRSPMLYTVSQGNVEGFKGDQNSIIYIVSSIKNVIDAEIPYVFTDGHGIMNFTEFYNDIRFLDQIDWDVMKSLYWADTNDDPDRKRRRQAEFLVFGHLPLELVLGVGVKTHTVKEKVEALLVRQNVFLKVKVLPKWYY